MLKTKGAAKHLPLSISIENLNKSFGRQMVLKEINLSFEAGELGVIVGPSGCGKSTLLRLLAGFIVPDSGTIWFGDQEVTGVPPEKRPTSLVFQNYALWPHKTVFETVAYGLRVRGWRPQARQGRVAEMLGLVGLEGLERRYPGQLSGGQQQRLALARSLAVSPSILLLDEPLSNLDALIRWQMRGEIRRLQQKLGLTTVYVTHDQEEALGMADRLIVMQDGQIEQSGPPWQIYHSPASPFVARFVARSNLLNATVVEVDEQSLLIALRPFDDLHRAGEMKDARPFWLAVPRANWRGLTPPTGTGSNKAYSAPVAGQKIVVAIRPQEISVIQEAGAETEKVLSGSPDANRQLWLNGTIQRHTYSGPGQQLEILTALGSLNAYAPAAGTNLAAPLASPIATSHSVVVNISAQACVLFDGESEAGGGLGGR